MRVQLTLVMGYALRIASVLAQLFLELFSKQCRVKVVQLNLLAPQLSCNSDDIKLMNTFTNSSLHNVAVKLAAKAWW